MGPWVHGSMDSWVRESMDLWIHGCIDPWIRESTDPWSHGSMDPCIHESMDPWIHGSMDPWIHASMDPQIHGSMVPWRETYKKCDSEKFASLIQNSFVEIPNERSVVTGIQGINSRYSFKEWVDIKKTYEVAN